MNWIEDINYYYKQTIAFIRFVTINFINDGCTYRASALAFTSLLAVVPLMTVGLAILSSFPVFQGLVDPVQDFVFQHFVPATGKIIQNYLQLFAAQVSKLSIWGVAFLFVTALLVMFTIERAMNVIWRVATPRHGVAAFLLYWSILSLAPIFLGLSLAASSYLISLPFIKAHQPPSLLLSAAPYLLSLTGFTFLYVVVPNHPVRLIHGLWGGIFATVLFESAKVAFAYYLTHYNTYELVYGAFATLPLFFVWVYWVWLITLIGAEICYALSVHYRRRTGTPLPGFFHALVWLHQLWLARREDGRGLTLQQLIELCPYPFAVDVNDMIASLTETGLIHETTDNRYMLSQDMNKLSLYDLSQRLPYRLPASNEVEQLPETISPSWRELFRKGNHALAECFSVSLEHLFADTNVDDNQSD
ncbi:YihY family inner membrane protein [Legionella spiritensis]|uniref:UPF0761 membrane protein Lspi_0727 n=1 Tax=Legionella spiritensis TaxID=452 RepID=A0A0W0Z8J1_LEGSP|nr:YihY family inner membrane protein [Legionella spiritensis]KTD65267.1 ribonuclease BN [Legionella spiritensis]SNV30202.1 ribonuclease BN [Legionella spiritensis]VEG91878.1 ribonuclease BN [Legionella spiritensis]